MVSQQRLKRPVSALVAIVFLTSLLITTFFEIYSTVSASTPIKPVILEVTDIPKQVNGKVDGISVGDDFDVQKMSIKQFNALRYDLLGRYDAIVFSPSGAENGKKYNPEQVIYNYQKPVGDKGTPYNEADNKYKAYIESLYATKEKDNDLTTLRVIDLSRMMKAGIPVWVHEDAFSTLTNQSIVRNFESLKNESDLKIFNRTAAASNEIKQVFQQRKMTKLEEVTVKQNGELLTNQVSIANAGNFAVRGKAIDFSYSLNSTPSNGATVELYIDFDSNDRFSLEEKVMTVPAKLSDTLSYTIDAPSYTSPRYWKVVVKDESNQTYHYRTGRFLLKDVFAKAKILQVTVSKNDGSSLFQTFNDSLDENVGETSKNMLNESGLYDFDLEITDLKSFENKIKKADKNSPDYDPAIEKWFYEKDLIIFGFKDSFGRLDYNGNLQNYSKDAAAIPNTTKALQEFIKRGQGVMFSHDMLYRLPGENGYKEDPSSQREWETAFGQDFAIKNLINFGKRGVYTTTKVEQVATGLFTEYPYDLPTKPTNNMVSKTHSQYFSLNMANEDLTVWYNLSSDKHTPGDAAHHYYMYTVNNLTYTGAGHETTFPQTPEKQIFVNTMFRAFIGSNHAPKIEVLSPPLENNVRSIYDVEPLYLAWNSIDYDFKDQSLQTRVVIDGKQIFPKPTSSKPTYQNVKNNEVQSLFHQHDIKGNGTLRVEIETKDSGGAVATEKFDVKVKPSKEAVHVSRTVSPTIVEVDQRATLTYDVSTKMPDISRPNENSYKKETWEIQVNEVVPKGYSLSETQPKGWSIDAEKNMVSAKLRKIDNNPIEIYDALQKVWIPFKGNEEIQLIAKTIGDYEFTQGTYTYKFVGDHASNNNANGKDIVQEGDGKLTELRTSITEKQISSIQLNGPIELEVGDTFQLVPNIQPDSGKKLNLIWNSSVNDVATVASSYVDNSGILTGITPGSTKVKVSYTKGNQTIVSNEIDVIVIDPVKNFKVNSLELLVGQSGTLKPTVESKTEKYQNYVFEFVEGNDLVTKQSDSKQVTVVAKKPGTAKVKVSLVNQPIGRTIAPILATVKISLPTMTLTPKTDDLWVYQKTKEVDGELISEMVRESVVLNLNQNTDMPLPIVWSIANRDPALRIVGSPTSERVEVQAIQGTYPNVGPILVTGAFRDFSEQFGSSQITVKEYPQRIVSPNIELYVENSPFVYAPQFYPATSTVRGYGMRVVQGNDVAEVIDNTKLKLKKPGLAKVQVATEDVSRYFGSGEGPEVVYSEFYVRVKEGSDPNPESPNDAGDYY
ncbi:MULTISPECIES: DUF5057 domain-containing protein [unclassified Exiguobacterium]|uniref:DUF5057 domain-containing protein n=1 Tax=unclassified Exiguobacterium TaxID=2644629 RepID=UPI00103D545A|nr:MULTISPECIES: DUF5057 domain-containing protein [unclassified Exiguobacterium]TCI45919.1 hypothetical protein EVJ31_07095 [Exiguobacterium sp. SH5S32]TCI51676.1 hypothetical protein EVJ25_09345 [Exiguobacterium sp. SH1S4]TCI71662.1 hypothetical protein EVJ23_07090 [Exiguobacterium sp. SH1S1]